MSYVIRLLATLFCGALLVGASFLVNATENLQPFDAVSLLFFGALACYCSANLWLLGAFDAPRYRDDA